MRGRIEDLPQRLDEDRGRRCTSHHRRNKIDQIRAFWYRFIDL